MYLISPQYQYKLLNICGLCLWKFPLFSCKSWSWRSQIWLYVMYEFRMWLNTVKSDWNNINIRLFRRSYSLKVTPNCVGICFWIFKSTAPITAAGKKGNKEKLNWKYSQLSEDMVCENFLEDKLWKQVKITSNWKDVSNNSEVFNN